MGKPKIAGGQGMACMLLTEKDTAHDMMGRKLDTGIKRAELYYQAVGEYCFHLGCSLERCGNPDR